MRIAPAAAFALLMAFAGCAGAPDGASDGVAGGPPAAAALADVWAGLDGAAQQVAGREQDVCAEPFGTWFADFGVRGVACVAAQTVAPTALAGRAPVRPFERGPHAVSAQAVRLDLDAENSFGHYDPAFVRWLAEAGIPEGATARALAKPVYQRHLARLARIYWLTLEDLRNEGFPATTPAGPLRSYADYLEGGPIPEVYAGYEGGFSVFAFNDRSETILPDVDLPISNQWEVWYETNTAYGFWLRRRSDGTLALWREGLVQLLDAFDASWAASHGV